jgi:hypothetical protein
MPKVSHNSATLGYLNLSADFTILISLAIPRLAKNNRMGDINGMDIPMP